MEQRNRKWYQLDRRGLSNLLVVCTGVLLYLGLTHLTQVRATLSGFLNVISPFIAGFAIAFLLNGPVDFFEQRVYRRVKHRRGLAILSVYILALLVIIILLQMVLPQVAASVANLAGNITYYLGNLSIMVQRFVAGLDLAPEAAADLLDSFEQFIGNTGDLVNLAKTALNAIPELLNFGVAIGNGLVTSLTALIASIYMLAGKPRLIRQLKKIIYALFPPKGTHRILSTFSRANVIFSGFINGKLLDSAIIGVLCFLLCSLFRIPYAILVSVVVGVTNVIPFFGPFIGAVPSIMILVLVDPWAALRFGLLIIALQQFDGNILGPKILGNSTGLSPIWVLIAIVVGGGLFGFAGMLLGVPTFAVIYALVRDWVNDRLRRKGIDADGRPIEKPWPENVDQ